MNTIRKWFRAWRDRRAMRRAMRVMAAAPRATLAADERVDAWCSLAISPALPALREYLDGLVADAGSDLAAVKLGEASGGEAAEALAAWRLAGRWRVDFEDAISWAEAESKRRSGVE